PGPSLSVDAAFEALRLHHNTVLEHPLNDLRDTLAAFVHELIDTVEAVRDTLRGRGGRELDPLGPHQGPQDELQPARLPQPLVLANGESENALLGPRKELPDPQEHPPSLRPTFSDHHFFLHTSGNRLPTLLACCGHFNRQSEQGKQKPPAAATAGGRWY